MNYFLVVKQLKFSLNCDLFDPRCEGLDYKVDIVAHKIRLYPYKGL